MPVRSMTGFGTARTTSHGWAVSVTCRSVNHRGLDTRIYVPRQWAWLEKDILEHLKERLHRGRVEVRVDVEHDPQSGGSASYVDEGRFEAVASDLRAAAESAGIDGDVRVADVLCFEDVQAGDEPPRLEEHDPHVVAVATEAIDEMVENRVREGRALTDTMLTLLEEVERGVDEVSEGVVTVGDEFRGRLEERVRDALEKFGIGEVDEQRLLQEVVHYADRSDISEEIQRAASHVDQLRELVERESDDPQGKQIDFYLQEMVREANTMGSKTGSPELTNVIIGIKSAVEKMREQAANIE